MKITDFFRKTSKKKDPKKPKKSLAHKTSLVQVKVENKTKISRKKRKLQDSDEEDIPMQISKKRKTAVIESDSETDDKKVPAVASKKTPSKAEKQKKSLNVKKKKVKKKKKIPANSEEEEKSPTVSKKKKKPTKKKGAAVWGESPVKKVSKKDKNPTSTTTTPVAKKAVWGGPAVRQKRSSTKKLNSTKKVITKAKEEIEGDDIIVVKSKVKKTPKNKRKSPVRRKKKNVSESSEKDQDDIVVVEAKKEKTPKNKKKSPAKRNKKAAATVAAKNNDDIIVVEPKLKTQKKKKKSPAKRKKAVKKKSPSPGTKKKKTLKKKLSSKKGERKKQVLDDNSSESPSEAKKKTKQPALEDKKKTKADDVMSKTNTTQNSAKKEENKKELKVTAKKKKKSLVEEPSTQRQIKFVARKKKKASEDTKKKVTQKQDKKEKVETAKPESETNVEKTAEGTSDKDWLQVTKKPNLEQVKETEVKDETRKPKEETEKPTKEVSKMEIDEPEKPTKKEEVKEKLKLSSVKKKTFGSGKKTFGSGKKKFGTKSVLSQSSPFARAMKMKSKSPFSQAAKLKKKTFSSTPQEKLTPIKDSVKIKKEKKKMVTPIVKSVKKSTPNLKTPVEKGKFEKKAPKIQVLDMTKKTPTAKPSLLKMKIPKKKTPLPKMKVPLKTVTPSKRPAENVNEPQAKKQRVQTPLQRQKTAEWYNRKDEPPNWGKKDAPSGAPFCLSGYRFVITGILDSLKRDECTDLIMEYGGRVTGNVSGMTAYLVAGNAPGARKIETAKEKKVCIIDEDKLFEMIGTLPAGKPPKNKGKKRMKTPVMRRSTTKKSDELLWVDKYKPKRTGELVGNASHIQRIKKFLRDWPNVGKKACLLSGAPGIGKTSSAAIVGRDMGYTVVELNASMARSKKTIEEQVKTIFDNQSIKQFSAFQDSKEKKQLAKTKNKGRTLLIMDEVDGMSSGDRGGTAALIKMIKTSKIPVLCICNDRQSTKVRSLANYCIDLKYRKPTPDQAWTRISQICSNEGLSIDKPAFTKLFLSVNGDIRQCLNHLQIWSASETSLSFQNVKKKLQGTQKDITRSMWDVAPNFFSKPHAPIREQIDWYFVDRSLIPFMVEDNYLKAKCFDLEKLADAAEAFADASMVEDWMMKTQDWSICPKHAVLSTTRPVNKLQGQFHARMDFPSQLGKIGKTNKNKRCLAETYHSSGDTVSGSITAFRLEFVPLASAYLSKTIAKEKGKGTKQLQTAVDFMKNYNIKTEGYNFMKDIETKFQTFPNTSAPVTRNFNKMCNEQLDNNVKPEDFKPKPRKKTLKKKKPKKATKKKKVTRKKAKKPSKKKQPTKKTSSQSTLKKKKKTVTGQTKLKFGNSKKKLFN